MSIFIYSTLSFGNNYYLNVDSHFCREKKVNIDNSKCNKGPVIGNLTSQISQFEDVLDITPEDNLKSISNIIRLKLFQKIKFPLRRKLMLSSAMGYESHKIQKLFKESYDKCDAHKEEVRSVENFGKKGIIVFKNKKEKDDYKKSLIMRYKIAILEIHRLNFLKLKFRKNDSKLNKITQSINQIYQKFPAIRTMLTMNSKLPKYIVSRLSEQLNISPQYRYLGITHQKINQILGIRDGLIDTSEGNKSDRKNFYRFAYEKILQNDRRINDTKLHKEIIKYDYDSTEKSIKFLGKMCKMKPCDIVQLAQTDLESTLHILPHHTRYDIEKFICNNCQIGKIRKSVKDSDLILSTLGTIGLGVGCYFSAPVCIPAMLASGGLSYLSFDQFKDNYYNEQKQKRVTLKRSIVPEENEAFELSLRELEKRERQKVNSAALLVIDTIALGKTAIQAGKIAGGTIKRIASESIHLKQFKNMTEVYRGVTLKHLPPKALEIYLKSSRKSKYVLSPKEYSYLVKNNLLDSFNKWTNTKKTIRILNEKLAILFRSRVRQNDTKKVLSFLKSMGKIAFPTYKQFQFIAPVKKILNKILLNPKYKLSSKEKSFLDKKHYLTDVLRFQDDVKLGFQKPFATIIKLKSLSNKATWAVTLGVISSNIIIDDFIDLKESFNEDKENGMSNKDEKVELIFTSPKKSISIRIGGTFYTYGNKITNKETIDQYKKHLTKKDHFLGNHLRIEFKFSSSEKEKLKKRLEFDLMSMANKEMLYEKRMAHISSILNEAAGIEVPSIINKSQPLITGYYNLVKLSGNEKVRKIIFASSGNPVVSKAQDSALTINELLLFFHPLH